MNKNIEWVVTITLEDGTQVRGVQKAMFGHPAMDFFAKSNGITRYRSAMAEKKINFDKFLAEGLRKPLI